jgi:hypothetical protein
MVTAAVTIILGAQSCELGEASTTTLAEQLHIRYTSSGAPGHRIADQLELVLVGARPPVIPLDDLEAVALLRLIAEPKPAERAPDYSA